MFQVCFSSEAIPVATWTIENTVDKLIYDKSQNVSKPIIHCVRDSSIGVVWLEDDFADLDPSLALISTAAGIALLWKVLS
jgi:hypothetical protein